MSSPVLPKEVPMDFHLVKIRELEKKLLAAELLALHHQRKREELQNEVEELKWDYEALKSQVSSLTIAEESSTPIEEPAIEKPTSFCSIS